MVVFKLSWKAYLIWQQQDSVENRAQDTLSSPSRCSLVVAAAIMTDINDEEEWYQ